MDSDDSLWEDPNVLCSSFCFKALRPMLRYVEDNHRKWTDNEGELRAKVEVVDAKLSSFLSSQKKLDEKIDNLENLIKNALIKSGEKIKKEKQLTEVRSSTINETTSQKIGSKNVYFEDNIKLTWQEAATSCHSKGRTLLTLESNEELEDMFPMLKSMEYWIGLNKNEENVLCASLTKYGRLAINMETICSEKLFFICQDTII